MSNYYNCENRKGEEENVIRSSLISQATGSPRPTRTKSCLKGSVRVRVPSSDARRVYVVDSEAIRRKFRQGLKLGLWDKLLEIRPEYRLACYALVVLVLCALSGPAALKWYKHHHSTPPSPSAGPEQFDDGLSPVTVTASPTSHQSLLDHDHQVTSSPDTMTVTDLGSLARLTNSTRCIIFGKLTLRSSSSFDWDKLILSASASRVDSLSFRGSISETLLSRLIDAFAPKLFTLDLSMRELCLGRRLNKTAVASVKPPSPPRLETLTLREANGCTLTPWVLTWTLPQCQTINFCSSTVDEASLELLRRSAAAGREQGRARRSSRRIHRSLTTSRRTRRFVVGLHDTELCGGCSWEKDANLFHISNAREACTQ